MELIHEKPVNEEIKKYTLSFLMPFEHFSNVIKNGIGKNASRVLLSNETFIVISGMIHVSYQSSLIEILESDERKNNFYHNFLFTSLQFEVDLKFSVLNGQITSLKLEKSSGKLESITDICINLENVKDPETNNKYQKFLISFLCNEI